MLPYCTNAYLQGKKGKATVNSAFAPLVADVNLVHEAGVKVADRLEAKLKVTFFCQQDLWKLLIVGV